MGDYTRLVLNVQLNKELPSFLENFIDNHINGDGNLPRSPLYIHPFFQNQRYKSIFSWCSGYFSDPDPTSFVKTDNGYNLSVDSNFKNYDHEIPQFLDLIAPYVTTNGICGSIQFEYFPEEEFYFSDGKVHIIKVTRKDPNFY